MSAPDQPVHATCVAIAGHGVLIRGAPGSGKTVLALELIRRARHAGIAAGLVADDRTQLQRTGSTVTASCPPPIAGLVEIRGFGISNAAAIAAGPAPVVLVADLVARALTERVAEGQTEDLLGIAVPQLRLEAGPSPGAAGAVLAALGLPPDV